MRNIGIDIQNNVCGLTSFNQTFNKVTNTALQQIYCPCGCTLFWDFKVFITL